MTASTVIPATYKLVIPQRATLRQRFRLPFDGTGKTPYAQIWKNYKRTTLILQLDVTILANTPKLDLVLGADWNESRLINQEAVWDLLVVNADTTRDHWLTGPVVISYRVTEAGP